MKLSNEVICFRTEHSEQKHVRLVQVEQRNLYDMRHTRSEDIKSKYDTIFNTF